MLRTGYASLGVRDFGQQLRRQEDPQAYDAPRVAGDRHWALPQASHRSALPQVLSQTGGGFAVVARLVVPWSGLAKSPWWRFRERLRLWVSVWV